MDSLKFAISMENDGEKYYLEQAKINQGNRLYNVFMFLAKEEGKHAKILENRIKALPYVLENSEPNFDAKSIFKDNENFKSEINLLPKQIEVYRLALEKEKQSIELYEKLLREEKDDESIKIFHFLINQEKNHFAIFDELILLILKATDWVENAEFGIRKEY